MIAIVDYRAGNLTSVKLAFDAIGAETVVTSDPASVRAAERVVFPGVGAAASAMLNLKALGLEGAVREAAQSGEGLESAARRLRYAALRRFRDELGADVIALAHHLDDQAETVLMHMARGAGPEGVCGMRERFGDLYRLRQTFRRNNHQSGRRQRRPG